MTVGIRILALVTDAYGGQGGIAQYNRDLLGALSRTAAIDEVVILPRSGGTAARDTPPRVRQLPARPGKVAYSLRAIEAALRLGPFDVVFCGHLFSAPLAAGVARLARAALWLQLHGIEAWDPPGRWQRRAAEQASLVSAVSRHTRRRFLAWANCAPETVKVLPNTVEDRFEPGPKSNTLLDRWQLHGKKVLLTVSRLAAAERYKGHDQVLHALASLKDPHPDLVYVIAGDGDDRGRLEQLAAELGLAGQTRFTGYVGEADLPDLFRTADLFVMPSSGEGFGIVFLQAIACGIPVIAGNADGARDPLREGMAGRLVAPDGVALAQAIDELLASHRVPIDPHPFSSTSFQAQAGRLAETLVHLAQSHSQTIAHR